MKKFISMVMAAAMVISLVPATAFADTGSAKAVAKVIDSADIAKNADEDAMKAKKTELQLKVDGDGQYAADTTGEHKLTFTLDGAEFYGKDNTERATNIAKLISVNNASGSAVTVAVSDVDKDSFKATLTGMLKDNAVITVKLGKVTGITNGTAAMETGIKLKSTAVGKKATIAVEGDMVKSDDLTFAEVKDTGIKATVKKVAEVAEEETTALERELKIEANVGNFVKGQKFDLKLSGSFEFSKLEDGTDYRVISSVKGEDKVTIMVNKDGLDTITIKANDMVIDANSAKAGAECKLTVKAVRPTNKEVNAEFSGTYADNTDLVTGTFSDTADAVVIAKVVNNTVALSVDKDDDVPVIYSGVNVANYGITDDSDHESLEVTIKESAAGALDVKKAINLNLPEGVYVTNVDITKDDNAYTKFTNKSGASNEKINEDDFKEAYKKGDERGFEFARRTLVATDNEGINDKMELSFKLTLVAEPGFTGDVKLKLSGDAFDKAQEVTIAKFVSPYTVEASQNDLIIDYRNTKVPTNVVVKEAEEGLWKKDQMDFKFNVDYMTFEDDATYTVDKDSDLEVKAMKGTKMGFKVTGESSDKAAAVTISDVSLYMSRSIAAGAYDLDLMTTPGQKVLTEEALFTASTDGEVTGKGNYRIADVIDMKHDGKWEDKFYTVKEGFINVITAGRDQDDASFTKKVVVPVGEKYLIAGEEQVALDVPAYISAQGYTMLPVRAVATALGINNNNVLWNQASRTVTILYGQRIITMVAGQKVVTVNGNTIPASATVQIKDGRTFLPMRDLATALGVTDITWDAATKTATMNGNQNK